MSSNFLHIHQISLQLNSSCTKKVKRALRKNKTKLSSQNNPNLNYKYRTVHFILTFKNHKRNLKVNKNQTYFKDYTLTHSKSNRNYCLKKIKF